MIRAALIIFLVAALATAITDLLATPPPDPAALAARADRYRLDAVAEAYLALFETVLRR